MKQFFQRQTHITLSFVSELFGTLVVTNAIMVIPTYQNNESTLQHVFQLPCDYLWKEDKKSDLQMNLFFQQKA